MLLAELIKVSFSKGSLQALYPPCSEKGIVQLLRVHISSSLNML